MWKDKLIAYVNWLIGKNVSGEVSDKYVVSTITKALQENRYMLEFLKEWEK